MKTHSITLFNRTANHDKVYVLWIDQTNSMYIVYGTWGRRSAFQGPTDPLDRLPRKCHHVTENMDDAMRVLMQMARQRCEDKGYTVFENGITRCSWFDIEMSITTHHMQNGPTTVRVSHPANIQNEPERRIAEEFERIKEQVTSEAKPKPRRRMLEL